MQNRSKVINKLALVLLSIVILELVLIGDRVQPVKAIKKKILLKKLKKVLPLLALMKPKKKIILLPIPIPMFNKHQQHQYNPYAMSSSRPMAMVGPQDSLASNPSSFMMIGGDMVGVVGVSPSPSSPPTMQMSMWSGANGSMPDAGFIVSPSELPTSMSSSSSSSSSSEMMMPAMTMTFQSSPSEAANSTSSAPLKQRPGSYQQQQQQQLFDNFDEPFGGDGGGQLGLQQPEGEFYYSSPWLQRNKRPLASPAKLLRNEKLRKQQQANVPASTVPQSHHSAPRNTGGGTRSGRLQQQQQQQQPLMPVLVVKNQWRPTTSSAGRLVMGAHHQTKQFSNKDPFQRQIQQQINQALEQEDLVPLGPPQLVPIYQTPNGQLHMAPPTLAPARPMPTTSATPHSNNLYGKQPPTANSRPAPVVDHTGHHQDQQQQLQLQAFDHEQETSGGNDNNDHNQYDKGPLQNQNDSAEVQTISSNILQGDTGTTTTNTNNEQSEHQEGGAFQPARPPHPKTTTTTTTNSHQHSANATKGKQQYQQPTKRKPIGGGGGY